MEDQERSYLLQGAVGDMVWKDGETAANATSVPILRSKLPLQVGDKSYNRTTHHPVKSRLYHLEAQEGGLPPFRVPLQHRLHREEGISSLS